MNKVAVFARLSRFGAFHLLFGAKGFDGKQMISVIAADGPVDGRHASLADFCGRIGGPFWFRPLMRTRRPVG
jgi:hypothetical protein